MSRMMIQINPRLVCQMHGDCDTLTDRAIISTNGIRPVRWAMVPACPNCLIRMAATPFKPQTPTIGATHVTTHPN